MSDTSLNCLGASSVALPAIPLHHSISGHPENAQGVAALLKRHGWSCQVPARRAIERDENVVAGWVKETWPQVEGPWRRSTPGSSSRTKPDSR
ncbi:winged helix-turn-helix domain-containing protein [Streptomyces sp. NBC_00289]|uniref:helix-turn-helix domain-containing protein n=1 Tax=Streptomyces sp. NBC_00289 TaxID=2975703 RepID=UPI00352D18A2